VFYLWVQLAGCGLDVAAWAACRAGGAFGPVGERWARLSLLPIPATWLLAFGVSALHCLTVSGRLT